MLILLAACSAVCPDGFAADPERAGRLFATVGAPVHDRVCFGELDRSVLRQDGVMLLDGRAGDAELAARVAHLVVHLDPPEGPDCVAAWMAQEERAHAIELRWRQKLGAKGTPPTLDGLEEAYRHRCGEVR